VDDPPGCTAEGPPGEIHTDFQKHFIRRVVSFDDLMSLVRWPVKAGQGAYRGKEYVMRDGTSWSSESASDAIRYFQRERQRSA